MAVFAQSTYSNLTNVTQVLNVANDFTSGSLGFGLWLLISFGAWFLMSAFNTKESLVSAAFISLVSGLLLAYIGLMDGFYVIIALIIYCIAMVILIFSRNSGGA